MAQTSTSVVNFGSTRAFSILLQVALVTSPLVKQNLFNELECSNLRVLIRFANTAKLFFLNCCIYVIVMLLFKKIITRM